MGAKANKKNFSKGTEKGSTILTLGMDLNDCEKILAAFKAGELDKFGVLDVQMVPIKK